MISLHQCLTYSKFAASHYAYAPALEDFLHVSLLKRIKNSLVLSSPKELSSTFLFLVLLLSPSSSLIHSVNVLSYTGMQRNPRVWKDPERFDPDRFKSMENVIPYSWIPFGGPNFSFDASVWNVDDTICYRRSPYLFGKTFCARRNASYLGAFVAILQFRACWPH